MPGRKRQIDLVLEPVMRSSAMKAVDRMVRAVAGKDVTLTLIGESGTGKEVIARRAHELSERRGAPFIPINCAAIPEALFESELFGHERGAFTGASERVHGKVGAAEGGTLFMDEIGEMPFAMQAKLLRFLENRRYMRVGGAKKIHADVRFVFATLRPLDQEVSAGRFRGDLLYRIQGITVQVPSLRDRRADIFPLMEQFVSELSARHSVRHPRFTRSAKDLLLRYEWPGNVRELRNVVETACLLRPGRTVRPADLPEPVRRLRIAPDSAPRLDGSLQVDVEWGLPEIVGRVVAHALSLEDGNTINAAARLRISPRTVQRYVASGKALMP
jgi:DNA-binding NtrC family response regulator